MKPADWDSLVSLAQRISGRNGQVQPLGARQETFAKQGDRATEIFLIRSGLVEHGWQPDWRLDPDAVPPDPGAWVGWSGPGNIVGLEALSADPLRTYDASLTAVTNSEIISIRASDLTAEKLADEPTGAAIHDLLRAGLEEQTRRLARLGPALVELREFTNQAVVARTLLELVDFVHPDDSTLGNVILLPEMDQKRLEGASGLFGTTLSTIMAEFARRGIVDWTGLGVPCILDRERLELVALNGRRLGDIAYNQTVNRAKQLLARGANGAVIALSRDLTAGVAIASQKDKGGWVNQFPNGLELALLEGIALARIGDTDAAEKLATAWGFKENRGSLDTRIMAAIRNPERPYPWEARKSKLANRNILDPDDDEGRLNSHDLERRVREIRTDAQALVGRILKDKAFIDTSAHEFRRLIEQAEAKYTSAGNDPRDYFANINKFTLSAILGKLDKRPVETLIHKLSGTARSYWHLATLAEACMLLDRMAEAKDAMKMALKQRDALIGNISSTRRQLARLAPLKGWERAGDLLRELPVPHVVAYTGHMMLGKNMDAQAQDRESSDLRRRIKEFIQKSQPKAAFGALAAGSDILIAEEMLAANVELHVILPMRLKLFQLKSVDPGDPKNLPSGARRWQERFRNCLSQAHSVTFADTDGAVAVRDEDSLFREASRLAVGQALLRADEWSGSMSLLAVWDGGKPNGPKAIAGTAMAVADALRAKVPVDIVECGWRPVAHSVVSPAHAEQIGSIVLISDAAGQYDGKDPLVISADNDTAELRVQISTTASCAAIRMRDPVQAAKLALGMTKVGRRVACHRGLIVDYLFAPKSEAQKKKPVKLKADGTPEQDPKEKGMKKLIEAFSTCAMSDNRPVATEPFAAILRSLNSGIPLQSLGPSVMIQALGQGRSAPVHGSARLFLIG